MEIRSGLPDTNDSHRTSRLYWCVDVLTRWENTRKRKLRRHNPSLGLGETQIAVGGRLSVSISKRLLTAAMVDFRINCPLPKELTITDKFVGWVEQRPIRKSTQENDFQDAKDLKPSKYK